MRFGILSILAIFSAGRFGITLALPCTRDVPGVVHTPFGSVSGHTTRAGVVRYSVPYATAERFAQPKPMHPWSDVRDGSELPPLCVQAVDTARGLVGTMSEDCLYATVYAPSSSSSKAGAKNRPVFVWVHGGSFSGGGARAAGLDGSSLAAEYGVVVVVLQYRLGLLGFYGSGNQAVHDVVAALRWVQDAIPAFGGDRHRVTLAGQSSGAHMVRVLQATPDAAGLFHRAVLHSDPSGYGYARAEQNAAIASAAATALGCDGQEQECLRAKSAQQVFDAGQDAAYAAAEADPSIAPGEPLRPTFVSGGAYTRVPSIVSNVANEGGTVVGNMLVRSDKQYRFSPAYGAAALAPTTRRDVLNQLFRGGDRAHKLDTAALYAPIDGTDAPRRNVERILTDGWFRCASWRSASESPHDGPPVYVAHIETGLTYPINAGVDYCADRDTVCHEDDILLLFGALPGTEASMSASQRRAQRELRTRWMAFAATGEPNAPQAGMHGWSAGQVLRLGAGTGTGASTFVALDQAAPTCRDIWGSEVPFDSQLYGQ